jgi:hypothetical protein
MGNSLTTSLNLVKQVDIKTLWIGLLPNSSFNLNNMKVNSSWMILLQEFKDNLNDR